MRKTALSLGHAKPHVKAEPCPTSAIHDFQPVLWKSWQQHLHNKRREAKFRPELDPHEINTDNGVYHFVRRNVQLKQDKYWSPPTLKPENTVSTAVSAGSVTVDPYFTQTTGDTSFTASPYWFRLRNRRDFYTHDDFLAVLLAEAYWENLLVKTLEVPKEPLKKRAGWSKWTKLTATKADSAKGTTHKPEDLAKAKKSQVLAVSSSEDQNLVALKRPFRQRFFAVFRALTGDYQGDAFIQDWVQHRVDEYKVGLKLWMNPSLLTKAVGQQVPNTAEALKGLVPAGKLTKTGFLPSSLEYMSFGGTYQSQFPLPYNLFGSLQLHPNIRRQLQDRHHLDLSNFGYVYHTIASWQPVNERRVGAAGNGYAIDKLYGGSPSEVKSQVTYPGLKSALRDASINAIIASLFGYSLRRRFYQVKPTAGPNLLVNESGLPVYRRRDTNPFGAIRVKLFQKRTWAQMHPTGDTQASRIWALRPQSKGMELSEDLLSSSNSLESYFTNIDRQRPDFAQSIVKT